MTRGGISCRTATPGCRLTGVNRLELRRSGERYRTTTAGVDTWHSFSFGPHYDPANTGFGPLVLHDEHRLEPGGGFAPHPHAGVEVVSWVLEGELVHQDAAGGVQVLHPGSLQHLSAGSGTVHSERAGSTPTRFVQAWLLGDRTAPSYAVSVPALTGLTSVLTVGSATLWVARLGAGEGVALPEAARLHLFLATGAAALSSGERLRAGDALRSSGPRALALEATEAAELLVWEMHFTAQGA